MLVVLDAGVFVSAAITPGGVAIRIITAGVEGRFDYVLCPRLVSELTDVLGRRKIKRLISDEEGRRFLAEVLAAGREVNDPAEVAPLSRDPDDDYLLALADEHQAERVVTGDADLLDIADPPVTVIGLRVFLELLTAESL